MYPEYDYIELWLESIENQLEIFKHAMFENQEMIEQYLSRYDDRGYAECEFNNDFWMSVKWIENLKKNHIYPMIHSMSLDEMVKIEHIEETNPSFLYFRSFRIYFIRIRVYQGYLNIKQKNRYVDCLDVFAHFMIHLGFMGINDLRFGKHILFRWKHAHCLNAIVGKGRVHVRGISEEERNPTDVMLYLAQYSKAFYLFEPHMLRMIKEWIPQYKHTITFIEEKF